MKLHQTFIRPVHIRFKTIPLLAGLLILVISFSNIATASAGSAPNQGLNPLGRPDSGNPQVALEQDATLGGLNVTVDGSPLALTPSFDQDVTLYRATNNAEEVAVSAYATRDASSIDQFAVGTETTTVDDPSNLLSTTVALTEGAITNFSLRVLAEDGVTTRTYHIGFSRPADPSVPEITIAADHTEYVVGFGRLTYTLTREGDTADSLDVTVNFTQTQNWLSDTARTATFAAGDDETRLIIPVSDFSSSVTQSGDLTATVAALDGYDTSGASAQVRVISQEGPALTVAFEHPSYTFAEDAGTVDIALLARYHSGVSQASPVTITVSVSAAADTAVSADGVADYQALSEIVRFQTSDFQEVEGALVGRKTVSVTINEDGVYEGDEQFHLHLGQTPGLSSEVQLLDSEGEPCGSDCPNPYVVTITDNDGPAVSVQFGQNAYTVAEGSSQGIIVTLSDDPERTVVIPITTTEQDGATGADFSGVPPTVTFNAGEMFKVISFVATRDMEDDDGESVKLSFGSMLPAGVTEGAVNETVVSVTHIELPALTEQPGISVPKCEPNGIFIYWHAGIAFQDDPPPYGWRVERRHHRSGGEWITTRFDFLGADFDALQTHSDEYWDWTDTTRRSGIDYTYRVHALDSDGDLMEGRNWSRRARVPCQ